MKDQRGFKVFTKFTNTYGAEVEEAVKELEEKIGNPSA